jgi:formylglycine-generating enzyme required for sulfatase activity
MGTDDPKLQGYFDIYGFRAKFQKKIKPAGKVHLEGFYIDTHEVTNGQYKKFVDDTKYNPPAHWEKGVYPAGQENYPVINVSWYDAEAYASWAGKRLPTEEEWEKAARGRGQRVFLWGDRSDGGIAELWKAAWGETEGPLQVGKFSFDRSPYGVMDMAGSVMEWTSGIYEYDESRVRTVRGRRVSKETNIGTEIVIKGGAWSSEILDTHISRKIFSPPDQISNGVGFRCAK